MFRAINRGTVVEVSLKDGGYPNYFVECRYSKNKESDKFNLSMLLGKRDMSERFKIDLREIDTQPITSSWSTIRDDIVRIVEYACSINFFDKYIERYEYICKCFDFGDNYYSQYEE